MEKNTENQKDKTCYCECCHEEIPLSAAMTPEGMDYVYHFCGNDCYNEWKQKSSEGKN